MGTYIVQSDIENVWGVDNVTKWANLDNADNLTALSRINASITYAEAVINDRFRAGGVYTVPLSGNSTNALAVITDMAAKLAGIWLYRSRGVMDRATASDKMTAVMEEIFGDGKKKKGMLHEYASGVFEIDAAKSSSSSRTDAPSVIGVVGVDTLPPLIA